MHIHVCISIHIPKYSLLSYIMYFISDFRTDCLSLENQLACSSLGKATCRTPSFPPLPLVLWRVETSGLSPVQFGVFTGVLLVQLMFRESCWWDFMGMASDVSGRHSLTAKFSLILWLLQFLPCLPVSLRWGCFVDMSIGTGPRGGGTQVSFSSGASGPCFWSTHYTSSEFLVWPSCPWPRMATRVPCWAFGRDWNGSHLWRRMSLVWDWSQALWLWSCIVNSHLFRN